MTVAAALGIPLALRELHAALRTVVAIGFFFVVAELLLSWHRVPPVGRTRPSRAGLLVKRIAHEPTQQAARSMAPRVAPVKLKFVLPSSQAVVRTWQFAQRTSRLWFEVIVAHVVQRRMR